MSGFKKHIEYGWFSHIICTIIVIPISIYNNIPIELIIGLIGISLPASLIGSILPDIDHPSSRTYKLFRYILLCSTIIFTSITMSQYQPTIQYLLLFIIENVNTEIISITIGCTSLLLGILITYLFEYFRPPHRGITHGFLFGIATTSICTLLVWQSYTILINNTYNIFSALIIGLYLFFGFCSHLYADDII